MDSACSFAADVAASAQQSFAAISQHDVVTGRLVRAALGLPDSECVRMLPALTSNRDETRCVRCDAVGVNIEVQHAAFDELLALRGHDAASAALWLLVATGPYSGCRVPASALSALSLACIPHGELMSSWCRDSLASFAARFVTRVGFSDIAGANAARIIAGVRSGVCSRLTPLRAEEFRLLHCFAGNLQLWQLFLYSARTYPVHPSRHPDIDYSANIMLLDELKEAAAAAEECDAATVAVAATLARDCPERHTVRGALHVASLVMA